MPVSLSDEDIVSITVLLIAVFALAVIAGLVCSLLLEFINDE